MRPRGSLSYSPGLDGIRALAVLAVFAYHLGTTSEKDYLPGGFIGVDVFFVLSGYLITSLLLNELSRTRTISIRRFYHRRIRRLLPALYAMMLTVGAIGVIWLPEQAQRLKGDLLASLAYGTNWWLIHVNSSYFGTGVRPPLLTHLWSLAVEEQFYLVWPVVLILFARGRRGRPAITVVLLFAIIASTAAAILLYDQWSDPSRVYYGTDTRAATPLIGALLAVLMRPGRHGRHRSGEPSTNTKAAFDLLGLFGLAGLAVVAVYVTDREPLLYQGGFLVVALLGAALVASAGNDASHIGKLLGRQPLRWLGQRSYAIYLWHWPVCVLTRPSLDIPLTGWKNILLRLGLTLALAELSYWLVERPIREGALFRLRSRFRWRFATAGMLSLLIAGGAAVGWQLTAVAAKQNPLGVPVDATPVATLEPVVIVSPSAARSPRTAPVKVAIFGDSQGTALYANRPKDIGQYLTLSDQSITACGIMRGRVVSRSKERFDLLGSCPNWLSDWRTKAGKAKADVALVIIGAWDVFDVSTKDGNLQFGTPQWDAAWADQLRQGLQVLREAGQQIALAELPCYSPVKTNQPPGWWPERGDDDRRDHVNALLRSFVDDHAIFSVTPPAEFCTDPAVRSDRGERYDGVHYLGSGSARYFQAVIPQILQLPST